MSKNIQILTRCAFVLIVIVIGNYVIVAQTVLTGDWKANSDSEKTDKIYLSLCAKPGRLTAKVDLRTAKAHGNFVLRRTGSSFRR